MGDSDGLLAVVDGEDRVAFLRALRADLAAQYLAAPPPYKAGLARELKDTDARIAALPRKQEASPADEIAARRSARRAGAKGPARSKRSS